MGAAQYQRSAYRRFVWYGHALTRRKIYVSIRLPVSRPSTFASIPARLSCIAPHSTRRAHVHERGQTTARRPPRHSAACTISPYQSNQHHSSNTQVTVHLPSSASASLQSGEAMRESTDEKQRRQPPFIPKRPRGSNIAPIAWIATRPLRAITRLRRRHPVARDVISAYDAARRACFVSPATGCASCVCPARMLTTHAALFELERISLARAPRRRIAGTVREVGGSKEKW